LVFPMDSRVDDTAPPFFDDTTPPIFKNNGGTTRDQLLVSRGSTRFKYKY
jgi:hypothetical protein